MKIHLSLFASALAALLVFSAAPAPAASIYSTDFDTDSKGYTFERGQLSAQLSNPWTTDDPYDGTYGGTDALDYAQYYSTTASDKVAIFGGVFGYPPGKQVVNVYRPFTNSVTGANGNDTLVFNSTGVVTYSADGKHDSFGFNFLNSSLNSVFQMRLTYDSTLDTGNDPKPLRIYLVNSAGGTSEGTFHLAYNALYTYQFKIYSDVAGRDALSLQIVDSTGAVTTPWVNLSLADGSASAITAIGTNWKITDTTTSNGHPTNFGSNGFILQNFAVSTIPEPTSAALVFGGLAVMGWRRRR